MNISNFLIILNVKCLRRDASGHFHSPARHVIVPLKAKISGNTIVENIEDRPEMMFDSY